MSAGETAVLVASVACCLAVVGLLFAVASLRRQTRALEAVAGELERHAVPLVADAHRAVDQAATELERVGAVLDSTESVHATVDSASKLAYRAFANPVVKVLAVRAGAVTGLRRLASGPGHSSSPSTPSSRSTSSTPSIARSTSTGRVGRTTSDGRGPDRRRRSRAGAR